MAWYDSTAFYHIYPLGLCGAEKKNDYIQKESKFKELDSWVEYMKNLANVCQHFFEFFQKKKR